MKEANYLPPQKLELQMVWDEGKIITIYLDGDSNLIWGIWYIIRKFSLRK